LLSLPAALPAASNLAGRQNEELDGNKIFSNPLVVPILYLYPVYKKIQKEVVQVLAESGKLLDLQIHNGNVRVQYLNINDVTRAYDVVQSNSKLKKKFMVLISFELLLLNRFLLLIFLNRI
jgi:hypothetical protein